MNFFEFNLRKTAGGKIDQGLKAENNPGLEPNQIFFQKKIPTNTVARAIQSFGRNGPWRAGWLSNGQNFDVNLEKSPDGEMLKISRG